MEAPIIIIGASRSITSLHVLFSVFYCYLANQMLSCKSPPGDTGCHLSTYPASWWHKEATLKAWAGPPRSVWGHYRESQRDTFLRRHLSIKSQVATFISLLQRECFPSILTFAENLLSLYNLKRFTQPSTILLVEQNSPAHIDFLESYMTFLGCLLEALHIFWETCSPWCSNLLLFPVCSYESALSLSFQIIS